MNSYLTSTTAELRREELLREAAHERLATSLRDRHPWRRRVGQGLIHVGRLLADEPADQPAAARPRARMV